MYNGNIMIQVSKVLKFVRGLLAREFYIFWYSYHIMIQMSKA